MFEINIDKNGYYAEGNDGTLVKVDAIPKINHIKELHAYKYDATTKSLIADEEKLRLIQEEVQKEMEELQSIPTEIDRLEVIEDAIKELARMLS